MTAQAKQTADIVILGAGSYGTALALCFARNGNKTILWGRNPEHLAQMSAQRCNQRYLPEAQFPDSLSVEANLETAVRSSSNILVVVPSHAFGAMLTQLKPFLRDDARLLWATKGLEADTGRLLQDVALDILGDGISLAALSGPTFAKEMARALPTAISLASNDPHFLK